LFPTKCDWFDEERKIQQPKEKGDVETAVSTKIIYTTVASLQTKSTHGITPL